MKFEAKKCEKSLPRSVWESYSAFANTFGGTIALGIDESKDMMVTGIEEPEKIVQDIWNILNNPEKVSRNLLTEDDIVSKEVNGKHIILVRVPRAERRQRPIYINNNMNNGTYRRNGSGDYHCTDDELREMIRESSAGVLDRSVLYDHCLKELDSRSIREYRNRFNSYRPDHPWSTYSDDDFLRVIGAIGKDSDEELKPTLAGLLMFGEECSICSECPNYHLDYLEFMNGRDWTDRFNSGTGLWSGNLFDFYKEVSLRIIVRTQHPLNIEGMVRIDDSETMKAIRELVINSIVHADYHGRGGIRIEYYSEKIVARNPGMFRIPFGEAENGGTSDPRNPTIMKMFSLIGAVENAGSGVRRIFDTCKKMGWVSPSFEEKTNPVSTTGEITFLPEDYGWDNETRIKRMMAEDGSITMDSMSEKLGISRSTVYRTIEVLKSRNEVARIGGKRGRWEVTGYRGLRSL